MAHLTFVHGIGNKPERDVLLEQWRIALLDDDGVDLDGIGVRCSMVYWADFLYDKPASPGPPTRPARWSWSRVWMLRTRI
jgi:hypothetical protein